MTTIVILISIFLALNMGISGFAISFAPSYGSGIIKKTAASLLYTIFVVLGAITFGVRVVDTLVSKLSYSYNCNSGLLIIVTISLIMFLSNILKVPQSTSFATVGAFSGAAFYNNKLNWNVILKIFVFALIFSILSFAITNLVKKLLYPVSPKNFRLHEKIFKYNSLLRKFILYTDCYSAFAVGSNNVANVVASIVVSLCISKNSWSIVFLILFVSIFFGIGSLLFGSGSLKTVSKNIIPLGYISSGIVSLVTSNFVVTASVLGLPTPYVQFTTFSVLGISSVKDGIKHTFSKSVVKKIISVWILGPIFAFLLSYILHKIFYR